LLGLALAVCLAFSCSSEAQLEDLRGDPSATEHYIPDDGYVEVPLDFEFPFYGRTFTNSWMFSNGVIGFLDPTQEPYQGRFGFCCGGYDNTAQRPASMFTLFPLQTDLINYGDGKFMTRGDDESMTYGWYGISEFGRPGSSNNFEAEIYDDGMYQFRYGEIDVQRRTTIGSTGDPFLGQYEQNLYGLPPNAIETITSYALNGMCESNPLYDPNCPGYAEAYAQQQFEQNCMMNPLYDPSCPGYEQAYYIQQCTIDPLYDSGCLGYEEAFFDQQCSEDPLYDSGCPGYAQAFFLDQCSRDPFYDTQCPGYEEAYLEQQCDRDPTYSGECSGYAAAMEEKRQEETSSTSTTAAVTSEPSVESLTEPAVTNDPIVDEVLRESREDNETIAYIPVAPEPPSEPEESESSVEEQQQEEEDPRESRRERLREIAAEEARNLANDISAAATVEQQQAIQARVMAMIGYVPGFAEYAQRGIPQPTNYYEPKSIYEDREVPDSNFGARNGLAQEILHERMVDMQYNREERN